MNETLNIIFFSCIEKKTGKSTCIEKNSIEKNFLY